MEIDSDVEYHTLMDTYHGYVGLCPKCYDPAWYLEDKLIPQAGHLAELEMVKRSDERAGVDTNKLSYKLQCGCSIKHSDDIIMVDEAIAHPVLILNNLGYTTTGCCAGHPFDPGSMYVAFDYTYPDIKASYDMLTKKQKKMMKLEKWIPGEDGGVDIYILNPTLSCAFEYSRTIDSLTIDKEFYRLEFDRDSVMKEWDRKIMSDIDEWLFNWGETSTRSVVKYGPMAPITEFIDCLYEIIQGCLSVSH